MDSIKVTIEGLEYRIDFFLSGVRVSTLLTTDLSIVLKECEQKSRMLLGLAKGKVLTSIESKH